MEVTEDQPVDGVADHEANLVPRNAEPKTPSRFSSYIKIVSTFLVGHGSIQALNLLTAVFLIRKLSISAYAEYSIALGFQATALSLTNLGLTDTITPLVGNRVSDKRVVGNYIKSAIHLRTILYFVLAPFCAVAFWLTSRNQGWGAPSQIAIGVSILVALFFSVSVSCYSTPLILNRRISDYYIAQSIPALVRLSIYAAIAAFGALGAPLASGVSAATIFLNEIIAKSKSKGLFELPHKADRAANREIIKCMLPTAPAAIFSSFQPQLALFLVSIFGQTLQIAEVAALSKIGQAFLVFNSFNSIIVEPFLARTSDHRLLATYLRVLALAALVAACLTALCFVFPYYITMLLGSKYRELDAVVPWVVFSSAISTLANVVWVMNRSRKWLYWRGSALEIGLILLTQIGFLLLVGVKTTAQAAYFSLDASVACLISHLYIGFFGFRQHRLAPRPQTE